MRDLTATIENAMAMARSAGEHDVETLLEAALEMLLLSPHAAASWDPTDVMVEAAATQNADD